MSHHGSQNGWALSQAGIEFPLVLLTKILITAVVTFCSLMGLSVEGFKNILFKICS